ncbi:hypothetical protein Tco_1102675 [Tanacetum coccineum]
MLPPPTPSSSNIMLPPPTPSGSNTMPSPLIPSGSNTMPSHATPSLNTSACSNTMPSHAIFASTRTNKGKCHLIPKNETDLPKVMLLAAEVVLAGNGVLGVVDESDEDHQFKMDMEALEFDHLEEPNDDKGMPKDVSAGKQPVIEDVSIGKQPMIEDDSLQVGAHLSTQESIVEANPKPTRSKKSKPSKDLNQMSIFHKNKGRSERIFNQKKKTSSLMSMILDLLQTKHLMFNDAILFMYLNVCICG